MSTLTPLQTTFLTRVRECLERERRDQKTIAELADMAPATITRYKRGQQNPNPDLTEIEDLANAFSVRPADLLDDRADVAALRQEIARLAQAGDPAALAQENDRLRTRLDLLARTLEPYLEERRAREAATEEAERKATQPAVDHPTQETRAYAPPRAGHPRRKK